MAGGHERGMRSGTLATHQIVGMGEAFKIAREEMDEENNRIKNLQAKTSQRALLKLKETYVNGDLEKRVPHNLNISFNYVEGESLIMAIKRNCSIQWISMYFSKFGTELCSQSIRSLR